MAFGVLFGSREHRSELLVLEGKAYGFRAFAWEFGEHRSELLLLRSFGAKQSGKTAVASRRDPTLCLHFNRPQIKIQGTVGHPTIPHHFNKSNNNP